MTVFIRHRLFYLLRTSGVSRTLLAGQWLAEVLEALVESTNANCVQFVDQIVLSLVRLVPTVLVGNFQRVAISKPRLNFFPLVHEAVGVHELYALFFGLDKLIEHALLLIKIQPQCRILKKLRQRLAKLLIFTEHRSLILIICPFLWIMKLIVVDLECHDSL